MGAQSGSGASELVRFESLTKRFPGVTANDDIDLTIEEGTTHALLGENGAGKTTLMNVLYGLYQPTEGTVYYRGEPAGFDSPRDAIRANIGMIHQHFMLVDTMTVTQNVVLGNEPSKWLGAVEESAKARERVVELSERYGFDLDPDVRINQVGVGVQQRVEIVKTLFRGADLLILDEPTAVLTPQEVDELFEVLRELTDQGKTIIFITHKLGEALEISDRITVLREGRNVGTVVPEETSEPELAEMMVGKEVFLEAEREANEPGAEVLSVSDLTVDDDRGLENVAGVDFRIREGEILGIAGVDGNGQKELVQSIVGLREPTGGELRYHGEDISGLTRRERYNRGMAYIPEDRQAEALVLEFALLKNGILGKHHDQPFAKGGRIDWSVVREEVEELIEEFDVRPPNVDAIAESLSGGNQQKFVVGRELRIDPDLLVASHPTRGIDIGSIEFIHDQLLDLRQAGTATILVSSKLDEIMQLSDRIAVMYEGEIMDVLDPETATEEQLGLLMAGREPEAAPAAVGAGGDE